MLILFLRAILLYTLVFVVLRMTGKRQVSDLQPFDLLITLLIADLASCAIADTSIPLVYSVVPILAVYLMQQFITFLCLKSAPARSAICGSPVILIGEGRVDESALRAASYTLVDLMDSLRSNGVFDLDTVAFAILETNGSMSVLLKSAFEAPSRGELGLAEQPQQLSNMLILDGTLCRAAMSRLGLDEGWMCGQLAKLNIQSAAEVFFMYRSPTGKLTVQLRQKRRGAPGECYHVDGEA